MSAGAPPQTGARGQAEPPRSAAGTRSASIDLLRGLDVLLMLFVNEMAGVSGTPGFLRHRPSGSDGMTVTDVVFPAFLFIVGLSVPFALSARLGRGDSRAGVWRHVLGRSLALLAIGVLMIAPERASEHGLVSPQLWNVLMTVGVVLVFRAQDPGPPARPGSLRVLGLGLLLLAVLVYRANDATGLIQLRPGWWGILGLIGWSYLLTATLYLLVGDRPAALLGFAALLYCVYFADEAGGVGWLVGFGPYLKVGRVLGSHGAVVVSGALLGVMIRTRSDGAGRLAGHALGYAAGLGAAGLLLHALRDVHPAFWIHKNRATPPWCLLSSAWTAAAWALVFVMVEIKGWRRWPKAVSLAGESALMAYLLAPLLLSVFALLAPLFGGVNPYEALGQSLWLGSLRSVVFAWAIVRLCGALRLRGFRLRL